MKKKLLVMSTGIICILALQLTDLFAADPKPQVIIIREEKKKEKKKEEGLKSFGTGLLGGFVGGALGSAIAKPREKKAVTARLSDRERKLVEEIAHLEDDNIALEREMTRIKRSIVSYETEVKVLKDNNKDLQEDLEKARFKKKNYKKIAQEKRDEVEKLKTALDKCSAGKAPAAQDQ